MEDEQTTTSKNIDVMIEDLSPFHSTNPEVGIHEPRQTDKEPTFEVDNGDGDKLIGEIDKTDSNENNDMTPIEAATNTSAVSGSFESCINKYIRCIDTTVATIDHEKCKTKFHSCSLSILSNSTLKPDEHIEASNAIPEQINQNKTIVRGKKLSRKLYNCIKSFSTCTKNEFGNCARTYQRCTLEVFDEDIQGRNAVTESASDNKDNEPDIAPEISTPIRVESTTPLNTISTTQNSVNENKDMEPYPNMDLPDPSSEYQNINY